jgi:hypothetical protein
MNDDIIRMAREAGVLYHIPFPSDSHVAVALHRFANLVRADAIAKEREACAKVCDDWAKTSYLSEAKSCAKIIRARGNT